MILIDKAKKYYNSIMAILTVVAIILSIYFYLDGNKKKSIAYIVTSTPSLIFDNDRISSNIRVIEKDSIIISENIYMIRGVIWNDGDLPIGNNDVIRNVLIQIGKENRIIDYKIITQNDSENRNFQLSKFDSTSLSWKWEYFEPEDGFKFQIIYVGNPNAQLTLQGKIIGIKDIKKNKFNADNADNGLDIKKVNILATIISISVTLFLSFYIITSKYLYAIIDKLLICSDEERKKEIEHSCKIFTKRANIIGMLIIISMMIICLYLVFSIKVPPYDLNK